MFKKFLIVVAIPVLAGCQLTVVPPTPAVPGGLDRPSTSELRSACTQQAARQSLLVRSIGTFATVTGSRGREIGAAAPMEVLRSGQRQSVQCNYSFGDRQVRITALDPMPPAPSRPTTAELRAACDRAAQSQRLGIVTSIGDFRPVGGSGGSVIGAAAEMAVMRSGQALNLQCNYSYGDQQVRFTEL